MKMIKWLILIFVYLFFSVFAVGEDDIAKEVKESLGTGDYQFFEGQKTNIRNPFQMRDPFRRELPRLERSIKDQIQDGFNFTNMPSIDGVSVDRIRITGVLLGENRRAIAKVIQSSDPRTGEETLSRESFILKEGMTVGEYDAEVKAILPGGVVLVEQILNVYDQLEFIETILPVRPEI